MELNSSFGQLRSAGVNVVAITPDAPEVLRRFATAYDIEYPMLADIGGVVVERYGVLNPNIPPNERQASGIPFPGHFLLAADGRVRAKAFTDDLRHRASGSALVAEQLGTFAGPRVVLTTEEIRAEVALSTDVLFGGQEAAVRLDLSIASSWHVYANNTTPPYTPLALEIDLGGDLLAQQTLRWPLATPLSFGALGETLPVHSGTVTATGRIRLRWSPPPSMFRGVEESVRRRAIPAGDYRLRSVLRYQACHADVCLTPREVHFELPMRVQATVPAP